MNRIAPAARNLGAAVLSAFLFALAYGIYCRWFGIHVAFLNAESGFFLDEASASGAGLKQFIRWLSLHSYDGHYTPIPLIAELLQARLYGTRESAWFWRQMAVCGMLAAAIFFYIGHIGRVAGLKPVAAKSAAVAFAVFFLCQPLVIEMVMWPFMAMQLLLLCMAAAAGCFLIRFIERHDISAFAAFVLTAYASMHIFGAGLSVSLAALLTGGALLFLLRDADAIDRQQVSKGLAWLALAFALTAGHSLMMLDARAFPPPSEIPLTLFQNLARFGGLVLDSVVASLRHLYLWSGHGFKTPSMNEAGLRACGGFALLAAVGALLGFLACRFRRTRDNIYLFGFGLLAFPFLAMTITLFMIVFRLHKVQGAEAVLPYLIGGRYIIFPAFYLLMMQAPLFLLLARKMREKSALLPFAMACSAVIGATLFVGTSIYVIWPYRAVDSEAAWHRIVAGARADMDAGHPVRDVDLSVVDPDAKTHLKIRFHILERELGCVGCVRFEGE
jgi:hypothetical protein